MKIAVVILNWNGKDYLKKFLPSVINYSKTAEIVVADNGSTDNSVPFLKSAFPSLTIIELTENKGFAQGYNDALNCLRAKDKKPYDYYVLLNSDVEVTENWIEPVILLMEGNKNIAAVQPKIRSYQEKNKFEYAGAAGGFIDKFGYPFCRGRIFDSLETDQGQYDDEKEIFWASGACMFVRAAVFHSFDGFDGDFFAHMEEIDLCWRMKNEGHKIFYCPGSMVYHIGGGTLQKTNPKKTYLNFRNNLWLLLKNLPAKKIIPVILLRLILDGIAGIKFSSQGNFADCLAVIRAHFATYFNLFSILKKRKSPKKLSIGIYEGSIVWEYFVKKKKRFSDLKISRI